MKCNVWNCKGGDGNVDIEPNEARLMISLIEFFMQHWYIQRHEEEEMLNAIVGVAQQKQDIRDHH